MRRAIWAALLAMCVCSTTRAEAHWQNTRWGMTASEVRALWPRAVEREETGSYLLRMDGPVSIGGVPYQNVRFVFDTSGGLRRVVLVADGGFDQLRDRLASQLGPPVRETDEPIFAGWTSRSRTALFRDVGKGNSVLLGNWPDDKQSTLTYRPLETGF